MSKQTILSIEDILANQHLIRGAFPSISSIIGKIETCKQIKLVYGETYDQFGLTIDSLKYYFFISLLHSVIESMGIDVTSSVIIGDHHSVLNKLVRDKEGLLEDAQKRLEYICKIKSVYNLKFEPLLMTQLLKDEKYQSRLNTITPLFQQSEPLKNIAKKTVLQNRISQETEVGFQYALEEVALITGYDIKIGPPREVYYDQIARELGMYVGKKNFCGIYLTPTYPLGMNFDYFVNHPEIEEYGVTPYKAGSNKLQEKRIIFGKTTLEECKKLIDVSCISNNLQIPNPVLDIYMISILAQYFLQGSQSLLFDISLKNVDMYKLSAFQKLSEYVYKPLRLT